MAIIEYQEGEHPAGFIGFRVVTTLGVDKEYRQRYFSVRTHDYDEARSLAEKQEEIWRQQAKETRKNRILYDRVNKTQTSIIKGLRLSVLSERRQRGGEMREYYSIGFVVSSVGSGKREKMFRTTKSGYRDAFVRAQRHYAEIHQLSADEQLILLSKMPSIDEAVKLVYKYARERKYSLTKKRIREMLMGPKE